MKCWVSKFRQCNVKKLFPVEESDKAKLEYGAFLDKIVPFKNEEFSEYDTSRERVANQLRIGKSPILIPMMCSIGLWDQPD